MADYCTAWPDGVPKWLGGTGDEWQACCKAHDQFYETYIGWIGYFEAHSSLAQCVAAKGFPAMGGIMFAGLCTLGTVYLGFLKLKGKFKK